MLAALGDENGLELFAVVGSAGTTNLGIVDDLASLADSAARHGAWFHVDGAYGGAADMITLLMVLFIVLFAIGQTDLAKFDALRHSLATAFGGPAKPNPVINGGSGVLISGSEIDGAVPEASGALGSPVPRARLRSPSSRCNRRRTKRRPNARPCPPPRPRSRPRSYRRGCRAMSASGSRAADWS